MSGPVVDPTRPEGREEDLKSEEESRIGVSPVPVEIAAGPIVGPKADLLNTK